MKTRFHENWMKADTRAGDFFLTRQKPGTRAWGTLRQFAGHQTELLSLLMHEWCTIKTL